MKLLPPLYLQKHHQRWFGRTLLTTLMLISVDLFANLDTYLSHELPLATIAYLTLLGAPQAVLFALGPPCCSVRPSFSLSFMPTMNISADRQRNPPLKIILPIIAVDSSLRSSSSLPNM